MEEKAAQTEGLEGLKRVRSEGCVLRRQQLVRNSPLPITSCYTLDEVIGLGSFSCRVYRATDILSGVRRVVKRVSRDQPEGVRLFRNEITFLRKAHHPNIVRLFEVFEDPAAVYHVTETCYGGDLHQWVDRRLRRRQRHARRRTVSFCSMDDSNTAQLQQQEQQEQQQQAIDPGLAQPSSAPTAATATAATTPNSMAGDSSRPLSPVASVGSGRAGSSMRISCPVAAGAAAAAATAAAAASGLAASSSPLSSSPTAAGAAGAAGAAAGGRPLVSEEMASQIAGQMLCALRYLHSREIAHCDIKLENILLAAELDDSEATGDGASSEEEEAALMQQQELELQQQQLLQQEQERNTCANSRARPSLRRQTGHNSSSSINSSSSLNALSVVPMVLRKRRGLGGGDGERSEPIDRDKETDKTRERDRGKAIDRSSRNLSLPVARDSPSDSTHSLVGKFRRKNITVKLADFGLAKKIVRGRPRQKVCPSLCVEGTLYYRSPWQILHGVEGDERSDLWALGVALFILFSGYPPFNGDDKASIDRAITDTPVSFNGGVWPSLSLPCLGFLRALLYNPLLPLHLRGPPPPPPYGQPTAERMLKHPWLQQCFREERRRLMRAVSAPSMNFLDDPSPTSVTSSGGDSSPFSASRISLLSPSVSCSSLQHARKAPSDPAVQTSSLSFKPQDSARGLQETVARAASDPPLLQHFRQTHSAPAAAAATATGRRGSVSCCSCCSAWRCPFGCAAFPKQQKEQNKLRICWGRAPLVAGDELLLPQQRQDQQQQQKRARAPGSEGGVGGSVVPAEQEEGLLRSVETGKDRNKQANETNSGEICEDPNGDKKCCVLQAFGVRALRCVSCEGEEALNFLSECSSDWRGLPACSAEQLQPHVRLTCPISGLLGLESCVAATNAAAAAAAAAAGVAKAVHREAAAHLQGPQQGPPLENVPHFHLPGVTLPASTVCSSSRSRCYCSTSGPEFNKREEATDATVIPACCRYNLTSKSSSSSSRSCCIAVADWLMVELFEARVLLLLLAAAWLEFASLSPLQKALRSVVAKLMENDELFRPVRDVLWVLDPQQSGHVSWQCLLDSLKVVRDFFRLEAFLRDGDTTNSDTTDPAHNFPPLHPSGNHLCWSRKTEISSHNSSNSSSCRWRSSNLPASPLQTILAFAGLSAGEGPQLSDLLPFCDVLDNAFKERAGAALSDGANSNSSSAETQSSVGCHRSGDEAHGDAEGQKRAGAAAATAAEPSASESTESPSCLMEEALVCLDTDGSGAVEFDEFLAASMTRPDFLERTPTCSVAFRLLDRNVDGFVSANDLLTILHFDAKSDLKRVFEAQKKRADVAVASLLSATAAAAAAGAPPPPGTVLDETELVSGVDEHGNTFEVPAGAAYILQLEGVSAATAPVYVQVVRELKATQPNANGLWTFEDFMNLL